MVPTFLGIFIYPVFESEILRVAYYVTLPALFNIGWASVQISNMAIVNSITYSVSRRDKLISLRNGFTFVANFVVLSMALVYFVVMSDPIWQFRALCFSILGLGCAHSLFYLFNLNEVRLTAWAKEYDKEYKKKTRGLKL